MRRRHFTCATAALAASWCAGPALAQGRELPSLVHRAGSLLSQSQRLGKSYALLGLGIEAADARRITNDCVAQSQRAVESLLAAPAAASARTSLLAMAKLWTRAGDDTRAAPTTKALDTLLLLDAQLLVVANEAVAQMLWQGKQPGLATIATAGRMAMLSQRLAKFHFCSLWGVAPRIAVTQMAKAKEEFLAQMGVLQAAARTPAQKDAIQAANAQWVFFEAALQGSHLGAEAGVHARLARASETMLLVLGEVAPRFARLG